MHNWGEAVVAPLNLGEMIITVRTGKGTRRREGCEGRMSNGTMAALQQRRISLTRGMSARSPLGERVASRDGGMALDGHALMDGHDEEVEEAVDSWSAGSSRRDDRAD